MVGVSGVGGQNRSTEWSGGFQTIPREKRRRVRAAEESEVYRGAEEVTRSAQREPAMPGIAPRAFAALTGNLVRIAQPRSPRANYPVCGGVGDAEGCAGFVGGVGREGEDGRVKGEAVLGIRARFRA